MGGSHQKVKLAALALLQAEGLTNVWPVFCCNHLIILVSVPIQCPCPERD